MTWTAARGTGKGTGNGTGAGKDDGDWRGRWSLGVLGRRGRDDDEKEKGKEKGKGKGRERTADEGKNDDRVSPDRRSPLRRSNGSNSNINRLSRGDDFRDSKVSRTLSSPYQPLSSLYLAPYMSLF